jgi:hypothetical protein
MVAHEPIIFEGMTATIAHPVRCFFRIGCCLLPARLRVSPWLWRSQWCLSDPLPPIRGQGLTWARFYVRQGRLADAAANPREALAFFEKQPQTKGLNYNLYAQIARDLLAGIPDIQ